MKRIAFLIAGYKGYNFLKNFHKECRVSCVASYATKGTLDNAYDSIKKICTKEKYDFMERKDLHRHGIENADLVFIAGWQYLIDKTDDRFVVFHDSLLPRFRGFAPTVNALILGEKKIGVTALKPVFQRDGGPIYAQAALSIKYPLRIKEAYNKLVFCYVQIAREIMKKSLQGKMKHYKQNENLASYSLWRDEFDYLIDWNWPAEKISRFVDAVSWPYLGAKTIYERKKILVDKVEAIRDINFTERVPGKIWNLENNIPEVVCGKGMLRILLASSGNNKKMIFTKLRRRFGRNV